MPAMLNISSFFFFFGVLTLPCSDFYAFLFSFFLVYMSDWQYLSS